MEASLIKKIQQFLVHYSYQLSLAFLVILVSVFGAIELVRGGTLTTFTGIAMLLLVLVVVAVWVKKGHVEWILYAYVFIQPLTKFQTIVFGSIRLSFVLFGCAILGYIFVVFKKKSWNDVKLSKLFVPQALFVAAVVLSTLINIAHVQSFERAVLHLSNLIFVVLALQLIDSGEKFFRLVATWYASVTLLVLFGAAVSVWSEITGRTTSEFVQTSVDGVIRISSLTPDAGYFASLLLIPMALGLALLLTQKILLKRSYAIFLTFFVVMSIALMLISYSRAGFLAMLAVFFFLLFFEKQYRRYLFWTKFAGLIVAGIIVAVVLQPQFLRNMVLRVPNSVISQHEKIIMASALNFDKSKILFVGQGRGLVGGHDATAQELDQNFEDNISSDAIDVRTLYWNVAIKMFQRHPTFGLGSNGYPYNFETYYGYSYFAKLPNAHNIYLETAAEYGVVGLAALAYLVIRALVQVRTLHSFAGDAQKPFLYALGVAFIASLLQFFFQPGFNVLNLWLIIAALSLYEVLPKEELKKISQTISK